MTIGTSGVSGPSICAPRSASTNHSLPSYGPRDEPGWEVVDADASGATYGTPQPLHPVEELEGAVIAVMGPTGSGKTTLINTASGSQLRVSSGLRSCTNEVQATPSFWLDGRKVILIDTPGFDDTTRSDTDVLKMIADFLTQRQVRFVAHLLSYRNGKKLAGVIYIHRISDIRMGGISARNFRMFRELCGDGSLKNVVVLTNMWEKLANQEEGEERERELANDDLFFKPVLEKGARMMRHDNTLTSAQNVLRYFIDKMPVSLQIQRELVDEGKEIIETAAGDELNRELVEQLNLHKQEMVVLQREWQDALAAKDEETRREIEAEAKRLKQEMGRIDEESRKLASNFQRENEELRGRIREQEANRERIKTHEESPPILFLATIPLGLGR